MRRWRHARSDGPGADPGGRAGLAARRGEVAAAGRRRAARTTSCKAGPSPPPKPRGRRRIQIVPVASSGVDDRAEYFMRAVAAATQSRYIFLTDDSGIGNPHAEPDVDCYVVTQLASSIRRVLAGQISGQRVEPIPAEVIRVTGHLRQWPLHPAAAIFRCSECERYLTALRLWLTTLVRIHVSFGVRVCVKLVVVELPAKAKTIEKYLGPGHRVLASFGHVRDLPPKDGSVDPDKDFDDAVAGLARPRQAAQGDHRRGQERRHADPRHRPRPRGRGDQLARAGSASAEEGAAGDGAAGGVQRHHQERGDWRRWPSRARSMSIWSMPTGRAGRSIIWSASPCRRSCGASFRARSRRAACSRSRCG